MNHTKHSYLMIGLLSVGAILFFTGFAGGGVLFLLWPLACVAMMFFMMRAMGRMHGDSSAHVNRASARGPADNGHGTTDATPRR